MENLFVERGDLFYFVVIILGLIVGNFINVVIYRLPIMLEREWQSYYHMLSDATQPPCELSNQFNLFSPRFHCPHCRQPIPWWHNIPVVSFIVLRGTAACCHQKISLQYPIVELLSALCFYWVAVKFGVSVETLWACFFVSALIVLATIDLQHKLLPDSVTLLLLWAGLLANINDTFTTLPSAVIGAALGYFTFWIIYWLFLFLCKKEGLGFGDFKLLSALGAWFGWEALPLIIFISSFLGIVVGFSLIMTKLLKRNDPQPFGPYLAVAGFIVLFFEDALYSLYLYPYN